MDDETEHRRRAAPLFAKPQTAKPVTAGIDLTGKPKVWLLIGRGGSGKTVLARWMGWRMTELGRTAMIAALDPTNRSLATCVCRRGAARTVRPQLHGTLAAVGAQPPHANDDQRHF